MSPASTGTRLSERERLALQELVKAGRPVAALWSSDNFSLLTQLAKRKLITFDALEAHITPAGRRAIAEGDGK